MNAMKQVQATHNDQCRMAFGRPTKQAGTCPRCDELREGAAPRKGWGDHKRRFEAQRSEAIRRHDCKLAGCSYVCTFGDW